MKLAYNIGGRGAGITLTATLDTSVSITPVKAALDFSYSMFEHFGTVEEIAIKLLANGAECLAFSTGTLPLADDVTKETFPKEGLHYGRGTNYAPVFEALMNDNSLLPNSNVIFFTDGAPGDPMPATIQAMEVHKILKQGKGKVQFYYLGNPEQSKINYMRSISFPADTEPIVFTAAELEKILYGAMRDNVPVSRNGEEVTTGIWRVTNEEFKDEQVTNLAQCADPEAALACTAAMLNYMFHHKLPLSHQASKRLNDEVLNKFQRRPGVVDLMHKVREFAASSGMAGSSSSAMELLMTKANVVTGSVPDRTLIDAAVMALVRNPQSEYAKLSRVERDRIKAQQKEKARYAGLAKALGPIVEAVAELTVKYMQDEVMCYRITATKVLPPAVISNPECLAVEYCDQLVKFEHGDHALLPVNCDSADYIKTLTFGLLGGRILTKKAHLCLLNGLFKTPTVIGPVISALKLLPDFECFVPPDAKKPKTFLFDPETISARNYLFLPYFVPQNVVPESILQGVTAVLQQACVPLPLDTSRLSVPVPVNVANVIAALRQEQCNVAELSTNTFKRLEFDLRVDDPQALAQTILASYTISPPPPEGVAPALPTRDQFVRVLYEIVKHFSPQFSQLPSNKQADSFVCEAGLRLSVAHSIGATRTSGILHSCEDITVTIGPLVFTPSEQTAKDLLVKLVNEQLFEAGMAPFVNLVRLEEHPLVYLRVACGQADHIETVVKLVDWDRYRPTSAWPSHALDVVSKLPLRNRESALAIANLRQTFDASVLGPEDIAFVLMNATECVPTRVADGRSVLNYIPFDAISMRNALTLLEDPRTGLDLLKTAEGCVLSADQIRIALILRGLGVDVSHFRSQMGESPETQRVVTSWTRQTGIGLQPEKMVSWFTKRHNSFYEVNMTPKKYYETRLEKFKNGPPKALRRTEALGAWLRAAGVVC
jgi:hypothetical protein